MIEQTQSISNLMNDIEAEHALLPEFQRDFVWELGKTYDLFDSLCKDIFIGSIIYGIPSFDITTRQLDDSPRKKIAKKKKKFLVTSYTKEVIIEKQKLDKSKFRLILDGQQRITSIYRALNGIDRVWFIGKSENDVGITEKVGVENDRSIEELLHCFDGEDDHDRLSISLSDAWKMSKTVILEKVIREKYFRETAFYKKHKDEHGFEEEKQFIYYLILKEKLSKLFCAEKLLSYYLLDMSIEKFVLFFERSNSQGVQLNFIDILSAKLYNGFKLRQEIEKFKNDNPNYQLNEEIIVRAIAYIVSNEKNRGVEIHRSFILSELTSDHFLKHWAEVTKWFKKALEYLELNHFLISQSWMPYENMLLPLMIFVKEIGGGFDRMNENQSEFIKYWYWASIFSSRYSGSSNEKIIADCKILTKIAKNEKISNNSFFDKICKSQVLTKEDLFSFSKKSNAIYQGILNIINFEAGGYLDLRSTNKILFTDKVDDHHIFPRNFIAKAYKGDEKALDSVDCVINRTLIPKILNIEIGNKAPSVYLNSLNNKKIAKSLESHLIHEDILTGTLDKYFDNFIEWRSEQIFNVIKKHVIEKSAVIKRDFYFEYNTDVISIIEVFATFNGKRVDASFNPVSKKIFFKNSESSKEDKGLSPSAAAIIITRQLGSSEKSMRNGWTFWRYIDSKDNQEKYIDALR